MFVYNEPALFVKDHVAISDLHLGITRDIYKFGVSLPSQVKALSNRLNKIKTLTRRKNLIITGDFKHTITSASYMERIEIPEFLDALKYKKIIIVKGNHDGWIEKYVPSTRKVKIVDFYETKDTHFSHGHKKVNTSKKRIIIGHNHPGIKFKDRFGYSYMEPVWIVGKVDIGGEKDLIIIPSFNGLTGKYPINEKMEFMGPVAKKIQNARAFLLDGTDLGNLQDLKITK